VAIPAIRLSGLYLALATLGFGILVDRFVYPMGLMFGGDAVALAPRPDFGLFDSTTDRGFYVVCAVVVAIGLAMVYGVHRSRLGRLLRGMSDSPLALTTLGTGVTVVRVVVFCLSAFLAGICGALLLSYSGTASGTSFGALQSLSLVVVLTIAGRGELSGPVVASVALYLLPAYITSRSFTDYQPVAFGVGAVAVCVLANEANGITARLRAAASRSTWRRSTTRLTVRGGPPRVEPTGEVAA
jgi:ABC-type branched-subunit amino acid transport system permease subunit